MEVSIRTLAPKKLIGKYRSMSLIENHTVILWQSVMPQLKSVPNIVSPNLSSLQEYPSIDYFENFSPSNRFIKWAAIEVSSFDSVPKEFKQLELSGGLYAVFHYKGSSTNFSNTMKFIFNDWMANSPFELEHRPHFELLGEKYMHNNSSSEEEIWIPIKKQ